MAKILLIVALVALACGALQAAGCTCVLRIAERIVDVRGSPRLGLEDNLCAGIILSRAAQRLACSPHRSPPAACRRLCLCHREPHSTHVMVSEGGLHRKTRHA